MYCQLQRPTNSWLRLASRIQDTSRRVLACLRDRTVTDRQADRQVSDMLQNTQARCLGKSRNYILHTAHDNVQR